MIETDGVRFCHVGIISHKGVHDQIAGIDPDIRLLYVADGRADIFLERRIVLVL